MIVGLNGNKGSGKDTVGAFLVANYGFERLSFAAALKESAARLFDVPVEFWEKWKNEPKAKFSLYIPCSVTDSSGRVWDMQEVCQISVREFLQRYGTESHRDVFGESFWVDFALSKVEEGTDYVVTDARFDNELRAIKDLGGVTIRVERESVKSGDAHLSEALPDFGLIDWHLDNNFDYDHLYDGVEAIMGEFGVERSPTPS